MAQRVAPLDALPRPSTHLRPTPSTRKAGWGGRGGTEASRLYFMDEKGNVVDADVVPGLLPRIATASMETDFVHQCDLKWRSSLELPATLYLLLAVAGCGFGDAFQRRAGTLPIRASSAGAAIIVACAMIWLKQSLSAAKMQAVFASAATFCVVACASSTPGFMCFSCALVVLAVTRSGCPERMGAAINFTTASGALAFQLATSHDVPDAIATAALLIALTIGCLRFQWAQAAALRLAFVTRTTENQRRKSLALFTEVQKRRNSNTMDSEAYTVPPSPQNSLDGPLQIALDQLRRATNGDASTQRLINKLVTLVARDHAWEPNLRDSFGMKPSTLSAGGHAPAVDDDTAHWLEEMVAPWQNAKRREMIRQFTTGDPNSHASGHAPDGDAAARVQSRRGTRRHSITMTKSGNAIALVSDAAAAADSNPLIALLDTTSDPEFDVESLEPFTNGQPLLCLVVYFASTFNLVDKLGLDLGVLQKYTTEVELAYRALPYHNALHAADVLVSAIRLMKQSQSPVALSSYELLAIIISCAVHDVDHPGVNNSFLVSTNHEFAIQHNDQSVLENHHLFRAFNIMRKEGCNFLKDTSYSQTQEFRHIMIELVLATDFAHHLKLVNQFKLLASTLKEDTSFTSMDDKLLLWRIVIKTADLGHCSKTTEQHRKWSFRVMEEMYRQGEEEAQLGFTVSAAMDRSKMAVSAKSQVGFLEFVCLPLFQAWHAFSRDHGTLERIESNIKMWKEMDSLNCPVEPSDLVTALPAKRHFQGRQLRLSMTAGPPPQGHTEDNDFDGKGPLPQSVSVLSPSKVEDIMRAQALPRRGHETVKLGLIGLANTGIAAKHRLAAARSTIAQRAAVTPPVQVVADLDEDTIAEDGSSHVLEADRRHSVVVGALAASDSACDTAEESEQGRLSASNCLDSEALVLGKGISRSIDPSRFPPSPMGLATPEHKPAPWLRKLATATSLRAVQPRVATPEVQSRRFSLSKRISTGAPSDES